MNSTCLADFQQKIRAWWKVPILPLPRRFVPLTWIVSYVIRRFVGCVKMVFTVEPTGIVVVGSVKLSFLVELNVTVDTLFVYCSRERFSHCYTIVLKNIVAYSCRILMRSRHLFQIHDLVLVLWDWTKQTRPRLWKNSICQEKFLFKGPHVWFFKPGIWARSFVTVRNCVRIEMNDEGWLSNTFTVSWCRVYLRLAQELIFFYCSLSGDT
jgi:hypothetical protein